MRLSSIASLRPLRRRNFALIWSGGLVSNIGSWMQTVAVGSLVTARTGKATWAVIVAAGAFLPIGLLAPVGGALADRFSRRRVLVIGNLVQTVLASILAELVVSGHSSPPLLTAVVTVQGSVQALISPFQQSIVRDLVPPEEILAAASLGPAQYNVGRVIGPALAGATIAAFGYPVAFVANAISFLAVVTAMGFVRLPPPAGAKHVERLFASIRSGANAAWAEPGCRAAIQTTAIVAFFASPFIALVPAVALHLSHGGSRHVASATGLLTTCQGVGAIVGAVALAPLAGRYGRGRLLMTTLVLLPVALIWYGLSNSLSIAAVTIGFVGLIYLATISGLSSVVQLRAPATHRARVISLYLVALGVSYPIGALLQGPIADRIGLHETVVGSAVLLVIFLAARFSTGRELLRALMEDYHRPAHSPISTEPSEGRGTVGPPESVATLADPPS